MFHAVYRHITRFLNWVNRTGSGSSTSQATKEAADHRQGFYGEGFSDSDSGAG